MSERAAYAVKERFSDPDSLGTVFVNDEGDLNVREAVQGGNGYIVTDNTAQIAALDRYEPLKRVALSEAEGAQSAEPLAGMTRAQLLEQPEVASIDNADRLKADDLRAAIVAERENGE